MEIIFFTKKGNVLRIPLSEVKTFHTRNKGKTLIDLKEGDEVIQIVKINDEETKEIKVHI